LAAAERAASARPGLLLPIICTLAAPVVLYFSFRALASEAYPNLAQSLPPANNASLTRGLAQALFKPDTPVDPKLIENARLAAMSDPLAAMPLVIAARLAEQNGDIAGAIAMVEEARRRRPRSMPARLYLTALYGKAERLPEFLREMGYVLSVNERVRFVLLPELVKRLSAADVRRDLAVLLATNPPWKRDFFNVARGQPPSPEHALDLLRRVSARTREVAEEERLYIVSLLAAGRADLARQRSLALLPEPERARHRYIFNGDFGSNVNAGEFGWSFGSGAAGRSDIRAGDGGRSQLNVQYYGGSNVVLAQQLLALPPGPYRLTVVGRNRSGSTAAGQLVWTVACQDGPELLRLTPDISAPQDKSASGRFTVPAGCAKGQLLRLFGEPGEASALLEAQFSRVEVADAR